MHEAAHEVMLMAAAVSWEDANKAFTQLYKVFADTAEEEIARITDTVLVRPGERGEVPTLVLRPILSPVKAKYCSISP